MSHRSNNTVRPSNAIDLSKYAHKTIHEVSKIENKWTIFVETSLDISFSSNFDYMTLFNTNNRSISNSVATPVKLPSFDTRHDVMIFFKYFDQKTSTLRYVFRMNLSVSANLKLIQEEINKKMKFPSDTSLLFFEEVKSTQILPLIDFDMSLKQLAHDQLLDGDIYVFQKDEKKKLSKFKNRVIKYFRELKSIKKY